MNDLPEGVSIKKLSFDEIEKARDTPSIAGWVYPKRDISSTIPLFSNGQKAALNFYGWVAGAMVVAGIILPFILGNLAWVLLVPGAVVMWRAKPFWSEQKSRTPFGKAKRLICWRQYKYG